MDAAVEEKHSLNVYELKSGLGFDGRLQHSIPADYSVVGIHVGYLLETSEDKSASLRLASTELAARPDRPAASIRFQPRDGHAVFGFWSGRSS